MAVTPTAVTIRPAAKVSSSAVWTASWTPFVSRAPKDWLMTTPAPMDKGAWNDARRDAWCEAFGQIMRGQGG